MKDLLFVWPGGFCPPLLGAFVSDLKGPNGEDLVRFRRGSEEGVAFSSQVIRLGEMRPDVGLAQISPVMGVV